MSIDITCYTSINIDVLKIKLDEIRIKYSYLFDSAYIIYEPHIIFNHQQLELISDHIERYNHETKLLNAEEFGLKEAKSYFLVVVNDKSFHEFDTSDMASMLRLELGVDNIIVILNGEDLI